MCNETAVFNFVGDVALFQHFENLKFDPLKELVLPEADLNVANFEFPLQNGRAKRFFDILDAYNVSYEYAESLFLNKFEIYGLANNHITDYGSSGVEDTIKMLEKSGSKVFGIPDISDVLIIEKNGISFALIAAVKPGRWEMTVNGPRLLNNVEICNLISAHKGDVDHVIVYFHWGTELVDAPNPDDITRARGFIDSGASCVIGHHPHVSHGVEKYKSGLIAYSLGSHIYLSEQEVGNLDSNPIRDISICLNIKFTKNSIASFIPYKYQRTPTDECLVPLNKGVFQDQYYEKLCGVIGDKPYYSKMIRRVLLKREVLYFVDRFKNAPVETLVHYIKYIKLDHFKKIIGR